MRVSVYGKKPNGVRAFKKNQSDRRKIDHPHFDVLATRKVLASLQAAGHYTNQFQHYAKMITSHLAYIPSFTITPCFPAAWCVQCMSIAYIWIPSRFIHMHTWHDINNTSISQLYIYEMNQQQGLYVHQYA